MWEGHTHGQTYVKVEFSDFNSLYVIVDNFCQLKVCSFYYQNEEDIESKKELTLNKEKEIDGQDRTPDLSNWGNVSNVDDVKVEILNSYRDSC